MKEFESIISKKIYFGAAFLLLPFLLLFFSYLPNFSELILENFIFSRTAYARGHYTITNDCTWFVYMFAWVMLASYIIEFCYFLNRISKYSNSLNSGSMKSFSPYLYETKVWLFVFIAIFFIYIAWNHLAIFEIVFIVIAWFLINFVFIYKTKKLEVKIKEAVKSLGIGNYRIVELKRIKRALLNVLFFFLCIFLISAWYLKEDKNFDITQDYSRTMKEMIAAAGYRNISSTILEHNHSFPEEFKGKTVTVQGRVFKFLGHKKTGEVISAMNKAGYRPATTAELLVIGENYRELYQQYRFIVALGTVYKSQTNNYCYPHLRTLYREQRIDPRMFVFGKGNWHDEHGFLGIRKNSEVFKEI